MLFRQTVAGEHRRPLMSYAYGAVLVAAFLLSSTEHAAAQTRTGMLERLEYLEQELGLLKQYRPADPAADKETPVKTNVPSQNAARMEVSLTAIEEEMRYLRGKLEEQAFEVRSLREELTLLQEDMDRRMLALEEGSRSAAPPVVGDDTAAVTEEAPAEEERDVPVVKPTAKSPSAKSQFNNASEHYDSAFRLLNESKYDDSAKLFTSFIAEHPKHELVGNAYYWLGETHYVRRQFDQAAEQFRKGFEMMPKGSKAPDNLLKLGMSLSQLGRNKEACVVLGQLVKKYPDQTEAVKRKAQKESARLKCS